MLAGSWRRDVAPPPGSRIPRDGPAPDGTGSRIPRDGPAPDGTGSRIPRDGPAPDGTGSRISRDRPPPDAAEPGRRRLPVASAAGRAPILLEPMPSEAPADSVAIERRRA